MMKGGGAVVAALGLAGCTGNSTDEETTDGGNGSIDPTSLAVVSEWNAMRTRLRDPVILGHAEAFADGVTVAGTIFERFEQASGEHNAHEVLEETDEGDYAGFEDGLGDLRSTLEADDLDGAHDAMKTADSHLKSAQEAMVGEETLPALNTLVMGAHVEDAALLAAVGDYEDAATEFSHIGTQFAEKGLEGTVAEADSQAAEAFTTATEEAATAANNEDADTARARAHDAFAAAVDGCYALVSEPLAGALELGGLQARGWDADTLARLGGPTTEFAHAAALNVYRARAHDAEWLYENGEADAAASVVENAFAHFEGARAHEALEEASEDAYGQFEDDGLSALTTAIENDDAEGVTAAVEAIDGAIATGIDELGSGSEPAIIEAGFFKFRIEDAVERYRLGESGVAADIASGLFERFEANEADFHETLEETDESLYETFEEEHLNGLITAFEEGDDAAVDEHAAGIRDTLLEFETAAGSTAQASGVESGYMAARVFDAGVVDSLGESGRAESLVQAAFQQFEAGAGGFHEALEEADHDLYESFEGALDEASAAASGDADLSEAAGTFNAEAIEAIYTVVGSAGGSFGTAATSIMQDTFADFEEARVHEALEEADHDAYEGFEAAMDDYIAALESGAGVEAAAEQFADAALNAQFAVAGAAESSPVGADASGGEESEETNLEGGPNVVEGVPDDADHVVEMEAVAFSPEELTIQEGDTVAWEHVGGEAHNVVAYEAEIPDEATYWASGGFESQEAAVEGWDDGQGAVQSGQSYVHTFETTGEHAYFCTPHEAAGMVGTIIVK